MTIRTRRFAEHPRMTVDADDPEAGTLRPRRTRCARAASKIDQRP
jgi:hypothetical protein